MPPSQNSRTILYQMAQKWDPSALQDRRDGYNYTPALNELLFHDSLRFSEYSPFRNRNGSFTARLRKWLDNVQQEREKQTLFKLAERIEFVDQNQMQSLYRDAYRRIIVPWLTSNETAETLLAPDFEMRVIDLFKGYGLYSITESFDGNVFKSQNNLVGLPKINVLSEDPSQAVNRIPSSSTRLKGLIILEDFVGTGKQSATVLQEIAKLRPDLEILFIPLIMVEPVGVSPLMELADASVVKVRPVIVVDGSACLRNAPSPGEREEFAEIRAVIKSTGDRVRRRLNKADDVPEDEFGYRGQGAMIVTFHNTPNNTLPIIHHQAIDWDPLFRRIHHSKDGL